MEGMTWYEFVQDLTRDQTQTEVQARTGVDQGTISRWKNGGRPSVALAAKFATGYGRDPLQAFVVAGFLTAEEAGMPVEALPLSLSAVSPDELAEEVRRRLVSHT